MEIQLGVKNSMLLCIREGTYNLSGRQTEFNCSAIITAQEDKAD